MECSFFAVGKGVGKIRGHVAGAVLVYLFQLCLRAEFIDFVHVRAVYDMFYDYCITFFVTKRGIDVVEVFVEHTGKPIKNALLCEGFIQYSAD